MLWLIHTTTTTIRIATPVTTELAKSYTRLRPWPRPLFKTKPMTLPTKAHMILLHAETHIDSLQDAIAVKKKHFSHEDTHWSSYCSWKAASTLRFHHPSLDLSHKIRWLIIHVNLCVIELLSTPLIIVVHLYKSVPDSFSSNYKPGRFGSARVSIATS